MLPPNNPPRYIVRHGITGAMLGQPHATKKQAEAAAVHQSKRQAATLDVYWCDDTGSPKVCVAYAYRGELTVDKGE